MKLDADGARRGIEEKIAEPLKLDAVAAAQAIVEIAIAKMSLAVREVSVAKGYDPRDFALVASGGAGPLHVGRDRARAAHPDGDRAAVPVALLGARHAAGRRAARLHPHRLCRSRQRRFRRRSSSVHDEMVAEAKASLRHAKDAERQIHLDLRYVGQEFTLQVPVDARRSSKRGDRQASAPPSTRSTSTATRIIRRTSRSRWSTSGSAMIGKRAEAELPAGARRAARADAGAPSARSISRDARKPVACPVYRARAARRRRRDRRAGADPGARHHHGAVRARRLHGGAVRRADHHGGRRVMTTKRSTPSRSK